MKQFNNTMMVKDAYELFSQGMLEDGDFYLTANRDFAMRLVAQAPAWTIH